MVFDKIGDTGPGHFGVAVLALPLWRKPFWRMTILA